MKILIAEDERITRMALVRQLQNWDHEVVEAPDGRQALETFEGACFDIVITDWEMPQLSGVDLVRRIRTMRREGYTYVIMLTSRSDKSDVVRGIEAGADDFVSKPFDREELRVRLLAGERIVRLERALSLQNAQLRDANERIRSGLEAAARVQHSMLPRTDIVTPRVHTAWKYVPTDELAGDAIGMHLVDDRFLVTYVLDVSGHGVPAALLSVSAMHSLEPIPEETSILRDPRRAGDLGSVQRPARIATELNRRFRTADNDGRYLTMILCVLDTNTGRFHFTSAGHWPPIILRGDQTVTVPDAGGLPIAIADGDYEDGCLQLQPGDRVCLYSDGILEQAPVSGRGQFGENRLLDSLRRARLQPVTQAVTAVVKDLTEWAGSGQFVDDVSLLMLDWVGEGPATVLP